MNECASKFDKEQSLGRLNRLLVSVILVRKFKDFNTHALLSIAYVFTQYSNEAKRFQHTCLEKIRTLFH